jgi:hypothetical protein
VGAIDIAIAKNLPNASPMPPDGLPMLPNGLRVGSAIVGICAIVSKNLSLRKIFFKGDFGQK